MNNNTVVEDIVLPQEQLEEFNSKLKLSMSEKNKSALIKKYFGFCCTCGGIPSKMVSIDVGDGATRIERYCDKCFKRWVENENTYVHKTKLRDTSGKNEHIFEKVDQKSHDSA